jgi:hypothetical protein
MSGVVFHQVKEGEFRRLAETRTMTKLIALESNVRGQYSLSHSN